MKSQNSEVRPSTSRRSRWLTFAAAWFVFTSLAAVWALATPISSGPDEPAHFIKAASVARGELVGPIGEFGNIVQVPQYVAYTQAQTCFVFFPEQPANCAPSIPGDPAEIVSGTTTAGFYNPLYYAVIGWPSLLFNDQAGLYAMRIMSGVFSSAFLALAVMMIFSWRRPTIALIGFAAATTPMVLYLNGIVNPSSIEVTATLAVFVAMLSIVIYPDERLLSFRATILTLAALTGANARGISPFWIALALLLPLILLNGSGFISLFLKPTVRVAAAVISVGAVMATGWTLLSGSLVAGLSGTPQSTIFENVGASPLFGFVKMLMLTFNLGTEMIGNFGWLDTPVPLGVYCVWSALVGVLVLASLIFLNGRRLALAIGLVTAVLLVPPIIQGLYVTGGGFIWQGRYSLPIFVCTMIGLGALLSERFGDVLSRTSQRRAIWIITLVWASAQGISFLQALRRNSVGTSGSWKRIVATPDWAPPFGSILLILGFALILVLGCIGTIVFDRFVSNRDSLLRQ